MTQLKLVDAAAWAASGAATAGTTGFSVCTGFTHVASANVPPWGVANGYIDGVDDAAVSFRLDTTAVPLQGTDTEYWFDFPLMAVRTATALAADATTIRPELMSNSGTKLRQEWVLRNNTLNPGVMIDCNTFIAGTKVGLSTIQGGSLAPAGMAFGTWNRIVVRCSRSVSGFYEVYHNGVLVVSISGLDTITGIGQANLGNGWTFSFPAVAGIRWRTSGPHRSYNGTDIDIRPLFSTLAVASDHFTQYLTPAWINKAQGGCWNTSGTATVTPTQFATSGSNPFRKYFAVSGTATFIASVVSIDQIGTLPYNAQGVAVILVPMVYVPNGSLDIVVNDSGGSPIRTFTVTGGNIKENGSNVIVWDVTHRYAVFIELSSSGSATLSIVDVTQDPNVGRKLWSVALGVWTPQAIGTIVFNSTLGASSINHDGVVICRWADHAGVDSLTQNNTTSMTPLYATANHLANQLPHGMDTMSIPGSSYPGKALGLERWGFFVISGWSGRNQFQFLNQVAQYMGNSHGHAVCLVDIASINDWVAVTDTASANAKIASMLVNLGQIKTYILANNNRLWINTGIRREQSSTTPTYGGVGSAINVGIDGYSAAVRTFSTANQNAAQSIQIGDPSGSIANQLALFTSGDDTHFNAAGDATVTQYMITTLATPAAPSTVHGGGMIIINRRRRR